ncbi:hypothetical protein [Dysgonomonas sp. 25]|uniref:hypothetical protein n=1 Tax=Dysgonomonas sp. 25 TaxID=2302933 RepID=UPI0013D7CAD7|nr:hypothetical protein [Dysgonomonas sp. 25]NDV68720.1 hypothetical protein [Dysgonomonas sp. 25]
MKKLFFCLLLFSISLHAFAHQDFYVTRDYGNIKTRIITGFQYEEINKTLIIGQLAEKLSQELNYKDSVLLYFEHHCTITEKIDPDYFVSYNDKRKRIEIRIDGNCFDVASVLKLLEYAIGNIPEIKKQQKIVHYEKHYNNDDILTIDSKNIEKILRKQDNDLVTQIMQQKIYRPDGLNKEKKHSMFTYYWQNNKFHIIEQAHDEEVPIIQLDNIYTYHDMGLNIVVFDSNNSFYHINAEYYKQPKLSRKLIIEDTHGYYRPYEVSHIGGNRITVSFEYYLENLNIKNMTLIYFPDQDLLIQDMDEAIDTYLEKTK